MTADFPKIDGIDDHSDWLSFTTNQRKIRAHGFRPQLEEASQAKVAAEHLVGDAYWDVFLQQVQAKIDQTQTQLEGVKSHFAVPGNPTQEEMTGMHRMAVHLQTKIDAFTEVLEMPREIIKRGEYADGELEVLVATDGESSDDTHQT